MKPSEGKAIYQDCKKRGYIEDGDKLYPPDHPAAANVNPQKKHRIVHKKTGWIDDTRNIINKDKHKDLFVQLVKIELGLDVWPEFYFTLEKGYRFDYAIPISQAREVLKIAIEVEGGIWAKGKSGHSSGTGIKRDMEKSTLANVTGWTLIRCTPTERDKEPGKIIELIKRAISTVHGKE